MGCWQVDSFGIDLVFGSIVVADNWVEVDIGEDIAADMGNLLVAVH